MRTIAAAEFKARCLTLMEDVQATRQPLLITQRGKPVAKLVPADNGEDDFIGTLEGVFRIVGDIESPAVPPQDWESS
jgi:prevent-host-death family protein